MRILFLLVLLSCAACGAGVKETSPSGLLRTLGLTRQYQFQEFLKPSFLHADFNGDGQQDHALLIMDKKTGKKGILIVQGNAKHYFVFGSGTSFGEGGDDFQWMDQWGIYTNQKAFETQFDAETGDIIGGKEVALRHPGLRVMAEEDGSPLAGGIIYWNGTRYVWIHQGE